MYLSSTCPDINWGFFVAVETDRTYMQLALDLAEKARGDTSPNPLVGAVVVKGNRIVGRGYHKKAGTPHAEINALAQAGPNARGACLYVTLEPCCHQGRTRPCTNEILKAGIKDVVYAMRDPNPLVNGKGAAALRRAGVRVRGGLLGDRARRLNEVYLKFITTGRPYVVLKLAQTVDGRIATVTGDSRWITGPEARRRGHGLRAEYDAVAVGSGTVAADNPALTVRELRGKNPYRIILSSSFPFKNNIHLFRDNDDCRTIVATTAAKAGKISVKNLTAWSVNRRGRHLDLDDFLEKAGRFGITSVLIEGGAGLATSFIREGLIDKYVIFMAPKIIGRGLEGIGDLKIKKMGNALGLTGVTYEKVGGDLMITAYAERS